MVVNWYYQNRTNEELGSSIPADLRMFASERRTSPSPMVRQEMSGRWGSPSKAIELVNGGPGRPTTSGLVSLVHSTPVSLVSGFREAVKRIRYGFYSLLIASIMLSGMSGCSNENQAVKPESLSQPIPAPVPVDAEQERQARLAEEKRLVKEEKERKALQAFEEAKQLLLGSLVSVGGTPEGNVKKGIEMLTNCLADADARNKAEARLLLKHAQIAVSDENAIRFLQTLDDNNRSKVAKTNADMIIVKCSLLEALSSGFISRFETSPIPDVTGDVTFIQSSEYGGGGKYCNSIETAFYNNLRKNPNHLIKVDAEQKQQQAEKQKAAREESPKLTALIFDIEENPEKFSGRCMCFDDFRMFGSTSKKSDTDYRLEVTDTRGKRHSMARPIKNVPLALPDFRSR